MYKVKIESVTKGLFLIYPMDSESMGCGKSIDDHHEPEEKHQPEKNKFRILIIGDSYVGKTSIIKRYIDNTFSEDIDDAIEDVGSKTIELYGEIITLNVQDTGGQEKFRDITAALLSEKDGVFIAYDISNRESFNMIDKWINIMKNYDQGPISVYIVGNKSDLERKVTWEEGKELAYSVKKYFGETPFFETSSKSGEGINEMFESVAKILKKDRDESLNKN